MANCPLVSRFTRDRNLGLLEIAPPHKTRRFVFVPMARSGHRSGPNVCPLMTQSGHSWSWAILKIQADSYRVAKDNHVPRPPIARREG